MILRRLCQLFTITSYWAKLCSVVVVVGVGVVVAVVVESKFVDFRPRRFLSSHGPDIGGCEGSCCPDWRPHIFSLG